MTERILEPRPNVCLTNEQLAAMVEAAGGDSWQEGATAGMAGDYVFKLGPDALRKLLAGAAVAQLAAPATAPSAIAPAQLNPVEPKALAQSIAELDAWWIRADGELLTPAEGESVFLVLHELKRLLAAQLAGDTGRVWVEPSSASRAGAAELADRLGLSNGEAVRRSADLLSRRSVQDAPIEQVQRIVHLRADRARRVYIAGPMTGLPEFNFPAFNAKAEELRAAGWHVENPAEHGHVTGAGWADYLRWDISRIVTCGAIHLLPGWSKSKGANLEVDIALILGMDVQCGIGAEAVGHAITGDLMALAVACGGVLQTRVGQLSGMHVSMALGELQRFAVRVQRMRVPRTSSGIGDVYLLQDARADDGRFPMWWKEGGGYTARLDLARRFGSADAMAQHRSRHSDIPWPLAELESIQRTTIDFQDLPRSGVDQSAAFISANNPESEAA
ncbi:DUF4406 domain-containing protein [uncultured Variovorax sp.]|uniref:DUF4406 domain-containing protein n=1 Tax=uncultured Variovorax sp. TaxID=114708 RepID=UPI00262CEFF0|nr:DUF4406 domain-containing protein [uncultured Variovorax sp.]